jgi:predicted GIY-YIG superfamily endonuclease
MYYVYIIKSQKIPEKFYAGYTLDITSRLEVHNNGGSVYTADHKPWELVWHCSFNDKMKAIEFERYLKSHSGRAFMQKRLA